MPRTKLSGVATVERREFVLLHALDNSENRGIDEADVRVRIAVTELADARAVLAQA